MHALLFGPLAPVVWLAEVAILIYLLIRQRFHPAAAVLLSLWTELGAIVFVIMGVVYLAKGKTWFGGEPKTS